MVTSVTSNGSFAFHATAALQVIGFPVVSFICITLYGLVKCGVGMRTAQNQFFGTDPLCRSSNFKRYRGSASVIQVHSTRNVCVYVGHTAIVHDELRCCDCAVEPVAKQIHGDPARANLNVQRVDSHAPHIAIMLRRSGPTGVELRDRAHGAMATARARLLLWLM